MAKRKQFLLRLPEPLHDELQRWARDELRSVNAQIEYILREAVRRRRHADTAPPEDSTPTAPDTRPAMPDTQPATPDAQPAAPDTQSGASPPPDPSDETSPTETPKDNEA